MEKQLGSICSRRKRGRPYRLQKYRSQTLSGIERKGIRPFYQDSFYLRPFSATFFPPISMSYKENILGCSLTPRNTSFRQSPN